MKTISINLLLALVTLTMTGCPEPVCLNPDPTYSFAVTARFTPEQDSISVGDTLYLVSEFPSTMIPVGGQEAVTYTHSTGIGSTLRVGELGTEKDDAMDAVASFDYINVKGQIYNAKDIPSPGRVQQLLYKEDSGRYTLKIGIIPKKKGIFAFGIGNGLSNGRTIVDECAKASFLINLTNIDPHLYYYESWLGSPVSPIPTNGYWVKVY